MWGGDEEFVDFLIHECVLPWCVFGKKRGEACAVWRSRQRNVLGEWELVSGTVDEFCRELDCLQKVSAWPGSSLGVFR